MKRTVFVLGLVLLGNVLFSQNDRKASLVQLIEKAAIPGLQLVYFDKDSINHYAVGVLSTKTKIPVEKTTIFQAASLSKPITAYIALKLVDAGILHLDKPLLDYCEYTRLAGVIHADKITARHVLSHTSGLPNWGGSPLKLYFIPGTAWRYSGEGYSFLSYVIEHLTKKPFHQLAEELVFGPLQMYASGFTWLPSFKKRLSDGHNELGEAFISWRPKKSNAAASLFTTASDYTRFMQALIYGNGLSETSRNLLLSIQSPARGNTTDKHSEAFIKWGLGIGLQQDTKKKAFWHWGDNGVFRAFMMAYPSREIGLVYLTNSENGLSIVNDILNLFFGEASHWAAKWINYPINNRQQREKLHLQRAFVNYTEKAALDVYYAYFDNDTSQNARITINKTLKMLVDKRKVHRASILLNIRLRCDPDNTDLLLLKGDILAMKKKYKEALSVYENILQTSPAKTNLIGSRKEWIAQGLKASEENIPIKKLKAYTGKFGEYLVFLKANQLYLRDRSTGLQRKLVPLNSYFFDVDTYDRFRIRFNIENAVVQSFQTIDINGNVQHFQRNSL